MSSDTPISVLPFSAPAYTALLTINPTATLSGSVTLNVGQGGFARSVIVPNFGDTTPLNLGTHDPADIENYGMLWAYVLNPNDTIVLATVVANPSGPAITNVTISGSTVVWTVGAGGAIGQTYRCVVTITTAMGFVLHKAAQFDSVSS